MKINVKPNASKAGLTLAFFSLILLTLVACHQLKELANFSKCEFKLHTVENIRLAGVNVQNIQNVNQLSVLDGARLLTAATQNNFPLELTLNLNVRNPNSSQATLNRLDWILLIDNIQMLEGTTQDRISIAPNGGESVMPMPFTINLKEALSGRSADALLNFGLNLAGVGNVPTRFTLRAKPYVYLGNFQIPYPGYIDIKTTYVAN